jgi:type VI secretion system protein ImpC
MRRVLHHPDFQAAEALWRGVEFLVRRLETGAKLQIVLYDISAEELAADLAAADALEQSALYALLVEQPALDGDAGALSMIAGLYQFEATPPHADLLGRIARIAAAAGAPFVAGVGPDALRTPLHEWHKLTKQAWEALRALPASVYLGLASPRFLLRMPYGKRSDPIDAFAFEEFSRQSGLSGMVWGNPALLAAYLVAESWLRGGKAMQLGSIATVGELAASGSRCPAPSGCSPSGWRCRWPIAA